MGAERLSAVITPEVSSVLALKDGANEYLQSRSKTAHHEAGHALVALYTEGAMPLHRVTVIPRGHSLGSTLQLPEMDRDSESYLELRARIDVAMGGRAAEDLIYGREK
jgi:ATP-dependent metalloprotease